MSGPGLSFEKKYQLAGWILFIASACFYMAAGIRSRDMLSIMGSLFFLVACIVFLIPFFCKGRSD